MLPGQQTLLTTWRALTALSPGARVVASAATVAAVFPAWAPLNNAILRSGGADAAAAALLDAYGAAGVDTWALWLPSRRTDLGAEDDVPAVAGMRRDTSTLVMRLPLTATHQPDDRVRRTSISSATQATDQPVRVADLQAEDGIAGLAAWVMVRDGHTVAGAWSMVHDDDCGIYAMRTPDGFRRQGFARALMAHILASAYARGALTATLQSTPMGRPLYASLGFEPVGRYDEWVPITGDHL